MQENSESSAEESRQEKIFRDAVAAIDKHCPNWLTKIKLNILDMDSPVFCILGQAYGNYSKGRWVLESLDSRFSEYRDAFAYKAYQPQWEELVKFRRYFFFNPTVNSSAPQNGVIVQFDDGKLMNVLNIRDVPVGVAFTIYKETVS